MALMLLLPGEQLRAACLWKGCFFLSLFLPPGQENDFIAKAFSRACRAVFVQREHALGLRLEQFSLRLSTKPRKRDERWQWGFAVDPWPVYEMIPAALVRCSCFTVEGA